MHITATAGNQTSQCIIDTAGLHSSVRWEAHGQSFKSCVQLLASRIGLFYLRLHAKHVDDLQVMYCCMNLLNLLGLYLTSLDAATSPLKCQ